VNQPTAFRPNVPFVEELGVEFISGVTIEMKTTFLQPAQENSRLEATGRAYHRSRSMAFCEGEIRDQDDRLIAKSSGIFKYRKE
jgi:uncharacterized protein (TIGR00369 family)